MAGAPGTVKNMVWDSDGPMGNQSKEAWGLVAGGRGAVIKSFWDSEIQRFNANSTVLGLGGGRPWRGKSCGVGIKTILTKNYCKMNVSHEATQPMVLF